MEWLRDGLGAARQPNEPRGGGDVKHGRQIGGLAEMRSGLYGCRESGMMVTLHGIDPDGVAAAGLVSLSELSGLTLSLWWAGLGPG